MDWQELLEQARQARNAGRYHEALQLADRAAQMGEEARYHAAVTRGDTLMEIGDAASALSSYESVADPAVGDPDLDGARGMALFELGQFPEADNALRSALRGRPELASAYFTLGLIAEIQGTGEEVELFRAARRLAPQRFPATAQRSRRVFEELVEDALGELPIDLQTLMGDVQVVVAEVPHPVDLRRSQPPASPCSLGALFEAEAGEPAVLVLYKRNLERAFSDEQELKRELRVTVEREFARRAGASID